MRYPPILTVVILPARFYLAHQIHSRDQSAFFVPLWNQGLPTSWLLANRLDEDAQVFSAKPAQCAAVEGRHGGAKTAQGSRKGA